MAGNKTRTNRLTNTDTGRGLWPPAGGRRRCGVAKAMAFAKVAGGRLEANVCPVSGREQGNALRFPRPCGTVRQKPSHPA
jgi:hypothetical protein